MAGKFLAIVRSLVVDLNTAIFETVFGKLFHQREFRFIILTFFVVLPFAIIFNLPKAAKSAAAQNLSTFIT
jgi:hypothetical protein